MENNKRIMLSLLLVAIIAIAAIGVGYAYTAMTTNSGNSASSEYITLTQSGEGAYTFAPGNQNIYWNTNDYKSGDNLVTDYRLAGIVDTTKISGLSAVQLGKPITLNTSQTGGVLADSLDCDLTCVNFTAPANEGSIYLIATVNGTPYLFKLTEDNTFTKGTVTNGTFTAAESKPHSFPIAKNGSDGYYTAEIKVYYAIPTAPGYIQNDHTNTAPVGPSNHPIDNATLTFTINASGGNNPGNIPLQGITVDTVAMSLAANASETADITLNPTDATNKIITASTSNADIATASLNAGYNTVTVTAGSTPGTAVITLVSQEGSYTAHITVTVTAPTSP